MKKHHSQCDKHELWPRKIIIGVGNSYRSDDCVGLKIARRLKQMELAGVGIVESFGEGVVLMDLWKRAEYVILIDAVRSGRSPGTIQRLDAQEQRIPSELFNYSTHAFSVAEAIEMARVLGTLPPHLVIFGIEGKDFSAGSELSSEVATVVEQVVDLVLHEFAIDNALPISRAST